MKVTDGSHIFDAFTHSLTKHYKNMFFDINPIQFKTYMLKVITKDNYDLLFFISNYNKRFFEKAVELFNDYKKGQGQSNKKSLQELSRELGLLDAQQTPKKKKKKKKKNKKPIQKSTHQANKENIESTKVPSIKLPEPISREQSSSDSLLQNVMTKQENPAQEIKRPKTTSPKLNNKLRIDKKKGVNLSSKNELTNPVPNSGYFPKVMHKTMSYNISKSPSPKMTTRKSTAPKISNYVIGLLKNLIAGNFKPFNGKKWKNVEGSIKKFVTFLNSIILDGKHTYEYLAKGSIAKLEIDNFSFLLHVSHGSNPICYQTQINFLRKGIVRSKIITKLAELGYDIDQEILDSQKKLYKIYGGFN